MEDARVNACINTAEGSAKPILRYLRGLIHSAVLSLLWIHH